MKYAHSLPDRSAAEWEPLDRHLREVGDLAATFAGAFGLPMPGRAAGLLHDIGKASAAWQAYLGAGGGHGPDHSTAGARVAVERFGTGIGRLLAFAIAGHHAGLADGRGHEGDGHSLTHRLDPVAYAIEPYAGWEALVPGLPIPGQCAWSKHVTAHPESGFDQAFIARMLFSCLVDADSLATEAFTRAPDEAPRPIGRVLKPQHLDAVRTHMAKFADATGEVNTLRAEVLRHATDRAGLPPGLFTLTVPTGGGKTLASLRFALEHAARHDLRRIVYVIPFTSIIEQTAGVFREALGPDLEDDLLEHHASFDWDGPGGVVAADDEGRDGSRKLRRVTENWDIPIVVTTAVQFFESLFAAKRGRCRKLHNLARSVIVLDEAQTLPVHLLRPCMAAMGELAGNYGASVILCTATQPALRVVDGALPTFRDGRGREVSFAFPIGDARELAPDPGRLYASLKRVTVERLAEPIDDAAIAARFAEREQMLVIVNSRAHARDLFAEIRPLAGARHLTTLMCAAHRQQVLAGVRADLAAGRPVRLVATSLIEAGVDVDFPEVWRAATGLDSIAQAAGRCNREGRLEMGRVVVFEPGTHGVPRAMRPGWDAARAVFRAEDDVLGLDAVRRYFRELYFGRGDAARLDAATSGGKTFPIMTHIAETARKLDFPFSRIARAFRMIDEAMEPILIPFDARAVAAIAALRGAFIQGGRLRDGALRTLQRYTVPVPAKTRASFLAVGAAEAIGPGAPFVVLTSLDAYDDALGLRIDDPTFRSAESNVMS